ncbi:MAG TPA: hypothetical protein VGF48_12295 [Thermoanaerobaculia bacterium]|jgi:hypothetical protein
MKSTIVVAILAVCLGAFAPQALACDANNAVSNWEGSLGGGDLNDFAMILRSANQPGCQSVAASKLLTKLQGDNAAAWTGWQTGAAVSFVLSAGLSLGAQGYLSADLDKELASVANSYVLNLQPGCGFGSSTWRNGNTCFEDYAIGMAAHGWRAAYYRLSGREWSAARSSAVSTMRSTLSNLTSCIHNPSLPLHIYRGVCNGSMSDLTNVPPTGYLYSINKGAQSPAYGIGQFTALAAGFAGLEEAEEKILQSEILGENRLMAQNFFIEGTKTANTDGSFKSSNDPNNCVHYVWDTNLNDYWLGGPWPCWDDENQQFGNPDRYGVNMPYRADMFPVKPFMQQYQLLPAQQPGFQFDTYSFRMHPTDRTRFWGPGRDVFYYTMPYQWFTGSRPAFAPRPEYYGGIKLGSYYVVNSAAGAPTATGTTRTNVPEASLTIVDLNQGRLRNGDTVAIRNKDNRYWHATGGGGSSIWASVDYINSNTTFVIVKRNADVNDPIAHNDTFALRAPNGVHYLTAPAGGTVSATATVIGTTETFKLERLKTD